ncbi:F-box domain profile [Nakaseomyces glabratus]|nr:F-box domain profile [Nakaseomyces glabratus]
MGKTVIELIPQEVFNIIAGFLESDDLWRIRQCSHQLKVNVEHSSYWSSYCRARWPVEDLDLILEDYDKDDVKILQSVLGKTAKDRDWFYYYTYRSRYDDRITKYITSLCQFDELGVEFWGLYRMAILVKPYLYIPHLMRITCSAEQKWSLEERSWSYYLLGSIRRRYFYALFQENAKFLKPTRFSFERDILLRFAALDPQYDKLIKYRNIVFEEVKMKVFHKYNGNSELFSQVTAKQRMQDIISALSNTISISENHQRHVIEDAYLLRAYANESRPLPVITLSIIEKIAKFFKIRCNFNGNYLAFQDNTLPGACGFVISDTRKIRMFSKTEFLRFIRNRLPISHHESIETSLSLDETVEPRKLLCHFLNDEITKCNGLKVDSLTAVDLQDLYPCSNLPPCEKSLRWVTSFFKKMEDEFNGTYPVESTGLKDDKMRISSCIDTDSWFFKAINMHPPDFLYFATPSKSVIPSLTDFFHLSHYPCIDCTELGTFIKGPDRRLCVTAIVQRLADTEPPILLYTYIKASGEIFLSSSHNDEIYPEESEFRKFISNMPYQVGLIFDQVDWSSRRLLLNNKARSLFKLPQPSMPKH